MEDARPDAAAAAAAAEGDWRSKINPLARKVMVDNIFKTLRWHLPVLDEERCSRLRSFAVGFERRFFKEAKSKDSYKRKIAMLLIYVENMNQNSHCRAPELPQDNDPAQSSGVPLTSLQQSQQPNTSTSVQDSYLPSLGQNQTGVGQAFTLQNMFGQSTIPHKQLMGTHSAIQSGAQQNPLNIGQQPMQPLCLQSPQYLEGDEDSTSYDLHPLFNLESPPSIVEDSDFTNVGSNPVHAEHELFLSPGTEVGNELEDWAANFLSSQGSGTQMENTADEIPNFESMDNGTASRKKRKFDHI